MSVYPHIARTVAGLGAGWADSLVTPSPMQIVADLKESNTAAQNKTALQTALDAAVATQKAIPGVMDWNRWKMGVIIPPGQYSINGELSVVESLYLCALVPGTVTLVNANSTYTLLQTAGNAARNQYVKGINFVGGKGAYQSRNTGVSVQGFRIFEDCKFDNYTECAVTGEEADSPYWKFVRCMFYGVVAGGTIGVAIGGYLDGSSFIECEFLNNKYHLKLGPKLSGSIKVGGCSFFMYASGIRTADIWIVPNNTDADGVNAGQGILIDNNKFGSENMLAGDVRVLIADEGTGTYRGDKHHSTTYNTTGFVQGINWTNNRISSVSSNTSAFIKSFVDNIWNMTFAKTNVVDGQYAYLCEFAEVQTGDNGYIEYTWNVDVPPSYGMVPPFTSGISNRPIGVVQDWYQLQPDAEVVSHGSGGDDAEYVNLGSFIGNADLTVTGSATKATTPDLYGTARASEVTAASATNSGVFGLVPSIAISSLSRTTNVVTADCAADHGLQVGQFVTIASATGDTSMNGEYTVASVVDSNSFTYASTGSNGSATGSPVLYRFEPRKLTWLECDIARGLATSVDTVDIRLVNSISGQLAVRRILRLPSTWRTVRIPFAWPDTASPTGWLVQVSAADWTTTTKIKFRTGRVRLYHGRQPMNHNHVRTGGNGAWDGEHIVLGAYHLWIDSTGDFRIKSSAPTSDTDGTVVGTQS